MVRKHDFTWLNRLRSDLLLRRPPLPLLAFMLMCLCRASDAQEPLPQITPALQAALPAAEAVLAKVNGIQVTGAEVRVRMLNAPLAEQATPRPLEHYVQEAIDRHLIEQFLESRRVVVPEQLVTDKVARFIEHSRAASGDETATLERMGLTESTLTRSVRLSLTWLKHAQATLTDEQFRAYFAAHREELDGSRVTLAYLYRDIPPEAAPADRQTLAAELTAAAKAGNFGEEVSTERRGSLPTPVIDAAFTLTPGTVSDLIETPERLYLVKVGERIPGQLSLEDVRLQVLSALAQQMWNDEVTRQRAKARIQLML